MTKTNKASKRVREAADGAPQQEAGAKKTKLTLLKEQEAWLNKQEKLNRTREKLMKKLQVPGGQTQKRMDKLAAVQAQIDEMKAAERQIAEAATPTPTAPLQKTFTRKKTPTTGISKGGFDVDDSRRAERRLRFSTEASTSSSDSGEPVTLQEARMALMASTAMDDEDGGGWDLGQAAVYGTSTALQKPYLRLTSAPAMNTIRPPEILERALALAKSKWRAAAAKPLARKEAYSAFCEQLKVNCIRSHPGGMVRPSHYPRVLLVGGWVGGG